MSYNKDLPSPVRHFFLSHHESFVCRQGSTTCVCLQHHSTSTIHKGGSGGAFVSFGCSSSSRPNIYCVLRDVWVDSFLYICGLTTRFPHQGTLVGAISVWWYQVQRQTLLDPTNTSTTTKQKSQQQQHERNKGRHGL